MTAIRNNELATTHTNEEVEFGSYFTPSAARLIVLSVCTFHAYEFYWFYRNWKCRGGQLVWVKTILSPFLAYHLFKAIDDDGKKTGVLATIPVLVLAVVYLLLITGGVLPSMPLFYQVVSFASFLPLLVVNNLAFQINKERNPDYSFVGLSVYKWLLLAPFIILIEGCIAWGYIDLFSKLPV